MTPFFMAKWCIGGFSQSKGSRKNGLGEVLSLHGAAADGAGSPLE
jgi:hypothetical protein